MIVRVDGHGAVTLQAADDLRRFSVAMPDTDAARAALAAMARLDGRDHAWIAPGQIRALAGSRDPAWEEQFAAMAAYAAGKGWTDGEGSLRAHIDYD